MDMEHPDSIKAVLAELAGRSAGYRDWGYVEPVLAGSRMPDGSVETSFFGSGEPGREQPHDAERFSGIAKAVLQKRKRLHAVLISRQDMARRIDETIPPILDDQAQLLGPTLRYADSWNAATAIRELRRRYAAVFPDGITVTVGSDLENCWIAAQLVEKTCRAWTEARALGGAKPINYLEAWGMHLYYRWKYSRISG